VINEVEYRVFKLFTNVMLMFALQHSWTNANRCLFLTKHS